MSDYQHDWAVVEKRQMTDQVADMVELEGNHYLTWDTPLDAYFKQKKLSPLSEMPGYECTACYRGYVADWVIKDGWLMLRGIRQFSGGCLLAQVFGRFRKPMIVADWFTGTIELYAEPEPWEVCSFLLSIERGRVIQVIPVQQQ